MGIRTTLIRWHFFLSGEDVQPDACAGARAGPRPHQGGGSSQSTDGKVSKGSRPGEDLRQRSDGKVSEGSCPVEDLRQRLDDKEKFCLKSQMIKETIFMYSNKSMFIYYLYRTSILNYKTDYRQALKMNKVL